MASAMSNFSAKDANMSGSHSSMRDAPQAVRSAVPALFTESAAMEKERDSLRIITAAPKTRGKQW